MNFLARYNLRKVKKGLSPDRCFKIALKKKLSAAWDEKYASGFEWYQAAWFKRAIAITAVIVIAGSLMTGAYAYTSSEVTTGTPLYPIKQQLEKVEEKLQVTPEAKAKFYLKQINKREAEAAVMKKRGQKIDQVVTQIKQTEDKLVNADINLEKVQSRDIKLRDEIKVKLENKWENRKEDLQDRLDNLQTKQRHLEQATTTVDLNQLTPAKRSGG